MAFLEMLKNQLLGGCHITVPHNLSAALLNFCMEKHIPYGRMQPNKDGISFDMSSKSAKKILKASIITDACSLKYFGLPYYIAKYRRRYGMFAGAVIAFLIIYFSGKIVWDIRVTGNHALTEAQVEAELAAQGFEVGSKIGERDVDIITNKVLLYSEKISWMSINFKGTVAEVQIREKETAERGDDRKSNANIVATENGIIDRIEVLRGTPMVKEGDSVNSGDLLISGLIETKHGSVRTEAAAGRIFAITTHSLSVEIPFEYEKKVDKTTLCTEKSIIFFSNRINIYRNSGNTNEKCDKIEGEEFLSLPSFPSLPIGLATQTSIFYSVKTERRSYEEASRLAFFELNNLILEKFTDADILEKNIKTDITESSLLLKCELVCSENIAKAVPFEEIK